MKKYETPRIEVIAFETTDIIQTSGEAMPQILNMQGVNVGSTNGTNIFE